MERGYIHITENDSHEFQVETRLVNGTLWLSTWEMANLLNVYTQTIDGSLQAIFKSGILCQDDVTRIHKFKHKGRECETTLYNLEALIFVSYRIASLEARAFRDWVMKALTEYTRDNKKQKREAIVMCNSGKDLPSITSLN